MSVLYSVHNADQAVICPMFFANSSIGIYSREDIQCSTNCAWCIPHFNEDGTEDYFTCAMNNRVECAMVLKREG